jgi:hypothetical protein
MQREGYSWGNPDAIMTLPLVVQVVNCGLTAVFGW